MSMLSDGRKSRVEGMSCGMFNNKSYWGYKSSVLKSGVCKYYRREMFDKFEWCVMEMMVFGLKNNGMLSNIINRMKILIMEEIVVDEIDVINKCVYLFNKIDNIDNEEFLKKVEMMKMICDLVKGCKKCRMVSYVNNWWKYNELSMDEYWDIELNKVLKYKKNGDSDELLKLGEWLIMFVEDKSEKVIDVYSKMLRLENEGKRYRRKDGVYLYFEILKDMCINSSNSNSSNSKLFDFVLDRFNRRDMKERYMFGVWFGLICIKNEKKLDFDENMNIDMNMNKEEIVEYLFGRGRIVIDEDFVVNDFHVNKKYGLGKFGRVGGYVENEKLSILGDNGLKYKEFYILKKDEMESSSKDIEKVKSSKKVISKVKKGKEVENREELELVSFDSFELVKVIVEGVCGLKKCCMIVRKEEELYVLKEMGKSFNNGKDYMFVDDVKKEFDILDLKMRLIRSDKCLKLKNKSIRSWKDNWELEEKEGVYSMMKYYENMGDLGKYKELLKSEENLYSMLKIRLFDGLFRSSDNILRNILVLNDGRLLSIDENDIFGKRMEVFGKSDWCLKSKWCKDNYGRVIDELWGVDKDEKKERIIGKLREYGFDSKVEEFVNRWDNYKEIVGNEFLK